PALEKFLSRPMPNTGIGHLAASALGNIGSPDALRAFLRAFPSPEALGPRTDWGEVEPDHGISQALAWGAGIPGLQPYLDRLLLWGGEIRAQAIYAATFLDDVEIETDKYISDQVALVRAATALYLAHRRGPSLLPTLARMAEEASETIERFLIFSALS